MKRRGPGVARRRRQRRARFWPGSNPVLARLRPGSGPGGAPASSAGERGAGQEEKEEEEAVGPRRRRLRGAGLEEAGPEGAEGKEAGP